MKSFFERSKYWLGVTLASILSLCSLIPAIAPAHVYAYANSNCGQQACTVKFPSSGTWQDENTITFDGHTFKGPSLYSGKYRYTDGASSCTNGGSKDFFQFDQNPTKSGNPASPGYFTHYDDEGGTLNCQPFNQFNNYKVTLTNTSNAVLPAAYAKCTNNNIGNGYQQCLQNVAQQTCSSQVSGIGRNGVDPTAYDACIQQQMGLVQTNSGVDPGADQAPAPSKDSSNSDPTGCDFNGDPLTWIICPVVKLLEEGIQLVDNFITSALEFDTCSVFDNNCAKDSGGSDKYIGGFYTAFGSLRAIAVAVLLIAALVMVSSQALGFEFLDAYTIKKTMPRILVAGIALLIAWPLMQFAIEFFNALGDGVRGLIYGPFSEIKGNLGASTLFVFGAGFVALFIAMGPAILTFLITAALAVLVGFLIIMVRYLAILVLIILAPIAIVCYVLPNTQKVWNLWRENFIGMLLVFPIISAFIAVGHVFSAVSMAGAGPGTFLSGTAMQAIGFIAYFLPYFLLPIAFRLASGVIGSVAGFVNDRHKGAFDRLKGVRQSSREARMGAMKAGFNRSRLGTNLQARRQKSLNRLNSLGSGALPGSARRGAEMHNAEMGHLAHNAAEAIKNNPSAAANDDANIIGRSATSSADFQRNYQRIYGTRKAEADAQRLYGRAATQAEIDAAIVDMRGEAIAQQAQLEQAYGAKVGTQQFKHTAATASFASSAAQDDIIGLQAAMHAAVKGGVMTSSQAASHVKSSGSLASSAGFGDLVQAAEGTMSGAELLDKAARGFNPQMSGRMRKGQAKQLGEHMALQASLAASGFGTTSEQFATTVADAAGIHDGINAMTPDVREEFAKALNGRVIAGKRTREWEAEMEGGVTGVANQHYLDRRKVWSSAAVAGGGATGGPAPGGTAGGGGTPGGTGTSSDRRLKRNILPLFVTDNGIQLYRFQYLWSDQVYVGVMAQDLTRIHPEALSHDHYGYYMVDYSKLGLRMQTLEEWETQQSNLVRK